VELAVTAANAALGELDRSLVDLVLLGNVLSAGHGMNIARQVSVGLDLPIETSAYTVNMMCGSGLQSAILGVQAIRSGDARAVLVGGVESMSQAAMLVPRPAKGQPLSVSEAVDSMQRDGLVDSFSHRHMGETIDDLARELNISRAEQDAWAERSQYLHAEAVSHSGFEDELAAVGALTVDEHPRPDVTRSSLATLTPVFGTTGTVTAGNSSGINDGAAMVLLANEATVLEHGWPVLAEWKHGLTVGCDPQRMGLGPVHSIRKLLNTLNLTLGDIDTLEINEAFAAQTLACLKHLEIRIDLTQPHSIEGVVAGKRLQVNPQGGAIAIGHPLAASGARLLTHLAWQIAHGESRSAIASLCIGGGMGIAAMLTDPGR
jgi:acetyl-CoA C-acetyltransferase